MNEMDERLYDDSFFLFFIPTNLNIYQVEQLSKNCVQPL